MQDQTNALIKSAMKNTPTAPIRKKAAKPTGGGVRRYQYNFGGGDDAYKRRPDNSISPEILRRFSVTHEVSRICINARKRQIAQLDWDITPLKSSGIKAGDVTKETELVKQFFKHLGGYKSRFRGLQDIMVEDLLTLDGISLYKEKDAAGRLLWLKPVDAATIKLVVDQWGNTPEPPNVAYRQYVRGQMMAEFTADQLIYDMMNPRSTTPYGLAPLESLIIVVSSALRSSIFNLDYLTYQNIPEGLLEMPEGWGQSMIDEFQDAWDSLVSGNSEASSKLRVVPSGTKYAATKKPDDMAFDKFNWWLMEITCAMFDIQPHEIGFTDTANRATAKQQDQVTLRKGIVPLAQMLKEIWDEVIQVDLGFPQLEFTYMGLEDENDLLDAQAMQIRLATGQMSIDEARVADGLEPIGIENPYIIAGSNLTWVTSGIVDNEANDGDNHYEVAAVPGDDEKENDGQGNTGGEQVPDEAGDYNPTTDQPTGGSIATADTPEDLQKELLDNWVKRVDEELNKFQNFAINRIKKGKSYRDFASDVLHPALVAELNTHASKAKTAHDIKKAIRAIGHLAKTSDGQDVRQNKTLKALYAAGGFMATKKALKKGIKEQMTTVADKLKEKDKLPGSTPAFLASATPAIAKTVDSTTISSWYKDVYDHVVPATYSQVSGTTVDFKLTSNAVTKQLDEHANTLLAKSSLDDTTKKTLGSIIDKGTKDGKTPQQIAKDIKDAAPDLSDFRANMIAVTETQDIFGQAQQRAFKEMGVTSKTWVTYGPDPCIECETNEGQGPIAIDATFDSGDDWTPGHPLCECACDTEQLSLDEAVADNLWDGSDESY